MAVTKRTIGGRPQVEREAASKTHEDVAKADAESDGSTHHERAAAAKAEAGEE